MATASADRLTEQQHEAVFRRETSVVLSSGAGCGKTHVLTRRYLSHLEEDGVDVSQIVAITFTERAARQMRDRIRKAVLAHLEAAATDEEVARWEAHLRGLETAQISTIHAFCGALLRQHAVEAGLDPRFDILEDYLAVNLQKEALTDCLQGLLTSEAQAGQDLRELILLYGWRPTVEAVQSLLADEDGAARQHWLERLPDAVAADWQHYARSELLPRYVPYLIAACPKVARCLWLLRTTPCLGPKMKANVALLLEKAPGLAGAPDLAAAVKELTEAAKVGSERAKAWPSEEIYETIKGAFEDFRRELPARLQLFLEATPDPVRGIEVGRRFLRVAEEAARAYRQRKRRAGVLDFQDLLVRARDLLRDHAEVRERLQRRVHFLLIDELQDTDPVQMELVEYLAGAGLTHGRLFAVGDHSQSVYRFRGAVVRLFQELKKRMPHEGRLGLTRNFRSQPALLDFTNALLGGGAGRCNVLEDYEPLEAHYPQLNPGPCVEFLWAPREAKELVTEARMREADWIARRIATMVAGHEALVVERAGGEEKLRPVRLGDVVLLFRAMSNVELYETALRRHGLDYYLVGGRAFFAQQEIYDLLNLLRALENPQDAVSLVGALRSPFCCLSDEALFVLTRHPEGPWAGLHDDATCARLPLDQRPRAARAQRALDRWHALKDRLPIAHLLGEVFADSGYDATTQFEFLGDRKLANLWKLQDMARAFDRSGLFGLAEFIDRLGDLVRTQPREEQAATQPESADVVRLMTIHQAKGLEFPVVIVPDLSAAGGGAHRPVAVWDARLGCVARPPVEDPPPFADFGWQLWQAGEAVEDWREDLRTLYVACTRAQDYLILSAALPADFSPQSAWMLALAEGFDLRTGRSASITPSRRRSALRCALRTSIHRRRRSPQSRQGGARVLSTVVEAAPRDAQLAAESARVRIVSVTELERMLTGSAAETAAAWDAEDGSDRSCWDLPCERVGRSTVAGPRDRVLRAVLGAWDCRESAEWEELLAQALDALPRPEDAQLLRAELEPAFRRFATSPIFRHLAKAPGWRRDVEYLVPLPPVTDLFESNETVQVHGLLDCLWQDTAGDRHLLFHDTLGLGLTRRMKGRQTLQLRFVFGALAVQAQYGAGPKTVRCHDWQTGRTSNWREERVRVEDLLADVHGALALTPPHATLPVPAGASPAATPPGP